MKTLKFLAIVLPMCVALVACDGKKSEPTNPTETAIVAAQDLCDYLPYTVDGKELKFSNEGSIFFFKVKSVDVDTANAKGNVKVVFDVRMSMTSTYFMSAELTAKTADNKSLEITYALKEGTYGLNGSYSVNLSSRQDLPKKIEVMLDEKFGTKMVLATIELKKGLTSFLDPELLIPCVLN